MINLIARNILPSNPQVNSELCSMIMMSPQKISHPNEDGNAEEKSAFLTHNGHGRDHNAIGNRNYAMDAFSSVAQTQQQHWSKNILTLKSLVYLAGVFVLFSKTKSRCTPPATFNLDEYSPRMSNSTNSNSYSVEQQRIPKIIHQSYKFLSTLPKVWASTPSRWKSLHPTYEYMFWSDDDNRNLISTHYPWFLETYDSYPAPIQRADAARYFAVLHYGGIYADLDILPIRNVDPLLEKLNAKNEDGEDDYSEKEMIVAETYNLGLTNALFASIPNSTVLNQFVHELPLHTKPLYGFEPFIPHFAVLLSTGPTRLWIYLNSHSNKILRLNPAGWGQCHQCKQNTKTCVPQEGSFFETTKGGSWHKWDTRIFNFIFCHLHFVIWGIGCALICLYFRYVERRGLGVAHSSGIELVDNNDMEQCEEVPTVAATSNAAYNSGKERRFKMLKPCNLFGSYENSIFVARLLIVQHRLPIFCVVILMLVL